MFFSFKPNALAPARGFRLTKKFLYYCTVSTITISSADTATTCNSRTITAVFTYDTTTPAATAVSTTANAVAAATAATTTSFADTTTTAVVTTFAAVTDTTNRACCYCHSFCNCCQ